MVECSAVPVWLGVVVNTSWSAYGAAVTYSCAPDFVFADRAANRTAECSHDGRWVPEIVECIGK